MLLQWLLSHSYRDGEQYKINIILHYISICIMETWSTVHYLVCNNMSPRGPNILSSNAFSPIPQDFVSVLQQWSLVQQCFANSSACAAVTILLPHCVSYSLHLSYTMPCKNSHFNTHSISVTLCHSLILQWFESVMCSCIL
jgi:hypothetical protein